ncbi:MAG: TetR/AcrR family transcriptional regulator [Lachnospiraceae bacterium]|nr:TetR/AcrR family transcriptional regulator [Lachnospiraceae bacterium]
MKTKTSRMLQAEKTKQLIIDTAMELLKTKTLDELTIQEICQKAHVSVGAYYHHLGSKEGIIIEIYKEVDEFFEDEIIPKFQECEPLKGMIDYLIYQVEYAEKKGVDMVRNAYKAQINNGNEFFLSSDRGLPMGLRNLVLRAQKEGKISEKVSAEKITNELLVISRGIIYCWCVSAGTIDMHENIETIVGKYLEGCKGV